jgi:argininosuccinate synthase
MHLKDELMPKYASLIYNGFWFAPSARCCRPAIDLSQQKVTGQVRVKLYKGNVTVIGRTSPYSLYDQDLVTFERERSPTTTAMPRASSSSMRFACGSRPSATSAQAS